jgi:hypothetical protein
MKNKGSFSCLTLLIYHLINAAIVIACGSAIFAWSNDIGEKLMVQTSSMNQVASDWQ